MLVLEECSFIQVAMKVSVRKYLQRCHLHFTVEEQAQGEQELKKEELGRAPAPGRRKANETADEPEVRPETRWVRNSSKKDTSLHI